MRCHGHVSRRDDIREPCAHPKHDMRADLHHTTRSAFYIPSNLTPVKYLLIRCWKNYQPAAGITGRFECCQLRTLCPATAHTHSVYQIFQTNAISPCHHMLPQVTCRYTGLYQASPYVKTPCMWLATGIGSLPAVSSQQYCSVIKLIIVTASTASQVADHSQNRRSHKLQIGMSSQHLMLVWSPSQERTHVCHMVGCGGPALQHSFYHNIHALFRMRQRNGT